MSEEIIQPNDADAFETPGRVTELRPSIESLIMTPLISTQWSVRPARKRANASSEWVVDTLQHVIEPERTATTIENECI